MGDWQSNTKIGEIGIFILFAIWAICNLITYPFRLYKCVRRYYRDWKRWPPKHERPKPLG